MEQLISQLVEMFNRQITPAPSGWEGFYTIDSRFTLPKTLGWKDMNRVQLVLYEMCPCWFCDLCFELTPQCGKPKNKLSQRFIGYNPSPGMMFIMTPSHGWLFMGWSHQTCKGDFDKSWQGTQGPSYHQHINGEPPWKYHVHPFMDDFPVKHCDVFWDIVMYIVIKCDTPSSVISPLVNKHSYWKWP